MERIYTVPLGEAYEMPRDKRTPRAMKILREFIERHMKAKGMKISISSKLNNLIWARSIQKPPRRVKVRLIKEDGGVKAYLHDEKIEEPKKEEKKAEAKKETAPAAAVEKKEPVAEKKAPEKPAEKREPVVKAEKPAEKAEKAGK